MHDNTFVFLNEFKVKLSKYLRYIFSLILYIQIGILKRLIVSKKNILNVSKKLFLKNILIYIIIINHEY